MVLHQRITSECTFQEIDDRHGLGENQEETAISHQSHAEQKEHLSDNESKDKGRRYKLYAMKKFSALVSPFINDSLLLHAYALTPRLEGSIIPFEIRFFS